MRCELLVARKKAGLTQEQMYQLTGVGRSRYSRIELGKTNPTVEEAFAIADVLGNDARDLFLSDNVNEMRVNEMRTKDNRPINAQPIETEWKAVI